MLQKIETENRILVVILLILTAYAFSIGMRMYWPMHFADSASMHYNNVLMINTNDGYFFASGAKEMLEGVMSSDKIRAYAHSFGLTELTAVITQVLPFSLETVILYMPAFIASLVVIPIVLTGRLMGHTLLGFLAALIGGIAWSYYNRTMVGYYDSDMFAIFLQFTIFYTFLYVAYKKDLRGIIFAALLMSVYPYFYPQGLTITYAMFIIFVLYMIFEYKGWIQTNETSGFHENAISLYGSIILLSITLMTTLPITLRSALFLFVFILLLKIRLKEKYLLYTALAFFIGIFFFSNLFSLIEDKVLSYIDRGVELKGLHFYQVIQTVREAGAIPMSTIANRISGSSIGLLISFLGFILLVVRHKPFIISLPLIGIGLFSYIGGLRFTVYAVPIAALSAVYFFWVIGTFFKDNKMKYIFVLLGTVAMLYPNITHIVSYKVPTVLNKAEVEDLVKLDNISSRDDYTIAWWDYGYPIWYYSDTSTLIDGGKHHNDNFIVSKIMQTSSPELAANLSRLAIETYVDSNYKTVANTLFKNRQEDQLDPNIFLSELEDPNYKLPKKTRDVYLYLPYRMMRIFPTVAVFGNLDLTTGKEERKIAFYPTQAVSNKDGIITFKNGITFNINKGVLRLGNQEENVKHFVMTQNIQEGKIKIQSQLYHVDGEYAVVYMQSYGEFVVMDSETFNSTYVQMFMLKKYDPNLFELVVSSPYSKIYRLKK